MKTCNKCKINKDKSNFYKGIDKRDGLSYYCKECTYLQTKKYKQSSKGKNTTKIYNKKYYQIPKNKELSKLRGINFVHIGRAWAHLSDVTVEYLKQLLQNSILCSLCNKSFSENNMKKHIDHILPINNGGLHTQKNIRIICSTCNLTRPRL